MNAETMKSNDDERDFNFYCPIHPEILKDKPGSCIQCGMLLVETTS